MLAPADHNTNGTTNGAGANTGATWVDEHYYSSSDEGQDGGGPGGVGGVAATADDDVLSPLTLSLRDRSSRGFGRLDTSSRRSKDSPMSPELLSRSESCYDCASTESPHLSSAHGSSHLSGRRGSVSAPPRNLHLHAANASNASNLSNNASPPAPTGRAPRHSVTSTTTPPVEEAVPVPPPQAPAPAPAKVDPGRPPFSPKHGDAAGGAGGHPLQPVRLSPAGGDVHMMGSTVGSSEAAGDGSLSGRRSEEGSPPPFSGPMEEYRLGVAEDEDEDGERGGGTRRPPPSKFESIDYDTNHSSIEVLRREGSEHNFIRDVLVPWFLSVVTAAVIAATSYALMMVVRFMHDWKLDVVQDNIDNNGLLHGYGVSLLFWTVLTAIATSSVFLVPAAAGSGIPAVKAFLNGVRIPGALGLPTFVAKVIGMAACLVIGFPAGREGPMVHIGACIGAGISRGYSKQLCGVLMGERFRIVKHMDTPEKRRDYVVIGSVCGVSVAFGAPIGAILFALEEVSSYWSPMLTFQTFVSACIGSYIAGIMVSRSSIHNEGWVLFGEEQRHSFETWEIPLFITVAAGGGIIGGLYNNIHNRMTKLRKATMKGDPYLRVVEAFVMIMVVMSIFFWLPTLYSCTKIPTGEQFNQTGIHFVRLTCDETSYNEMATLAHAPAERVLTQLFSRNTEDYFSPSVLAVFLGVYFSASSTIFGIAVPVGAFIPSMTIGAVWGRMLGELTHKALDGVDPGTYALVGAVAGLGGTTRMTISLAAIMVEITNDIDMLLPIMLSCAVSRLVSQFFAESIYNIALRHMGVIFLPSGMPNRIVHQTVKDAMTARPEVLPKIATAGEVQRALSVPYHAFPVVNDRSDMLFAGVITKSQLLDATHAARESLLGEATGQDAADAAFHLRDMEINADVLLDLRSYMNLSPFLVLESSPLRQAYRLFRFLGLRHLCVINAGHQVVGIMTRTNLNPETLPRTASLRSQYHTYPVIYSHTEEVVRMHRRNSTYRLYEKA